MVIGTAKVNSSQQCLVIAQNRTDLLAVSVYRYTLDIHRQKK